MSIFIPGVESNSILHTSYRSQSDDSLTSYERMHQSAVAYRDFELFMSKQCAILNIGLDGCNNVVRMVDYLNNSGSASTVAQLYDLRLYTGDGSDYIVGTEGLGDMLSKAWGFIVNTIKKIIGFLGKLFGLSSKSVEDTHKLVSEDSDKLNQIDEETAKEMQQMPEGVSPKGFFAKAKAFLTGGKANTSEEAIKAAQEAKDLKKDSMEASKKLPYYGKDVYDKIRECHAVIGTAITSCMNAVNVLIASSSTGNFKGKDYTDASRYAAAGSTLERNMDEMHKNFKIKGSSEKGYTAGAGSMIAEKVVELHNIVKKNHDNKKLRSPFTRYDLRFVKAAMDDAEKLLAYLKANPLSTLSNKLTNALGEMQNEINRVISDMNKNIDEKSRKSAQESLKRAKGAVSELSDAVSKCKDIVSESLGIIRNDARVCHEILSDMMQYRSLRSKLITGAKNLTRKSDTYKPEASTKYGQRVADKYADDDDPL